MKLGYDIVGDIHGYAEPLRQLLNKLGYEKRGGVYRHSERQMLFLGDFIDRGPEQREVLSIARTMCDAGSAQAVMGNHEFNAIGWATQDRRGGYLRPRCDKNEKQHAEFLRQLGSDSADHVSAVNWFRTLPVWLELPEIRLIHACWHEPSRQAMLPYLDAGARFTEQGFHICNQRGSDGYECAETLLKGPEQRLPDGISFFDKDGHHRDSVRLKWWDSDATTFRTAAIGVEDSQDQLPDDPLLSNYFYAENKPVFFGHYWLKGEPAISSPNAACLDYSVAKGGFLTAYSWSGEAKLSANNLTFVPA